MLSKASLTSSPVNTDEIEPAFTALLRNYRMLIDTTVSLNDRLARVADRLLGPIPSKAADSGKPCPPVDSVLRSFDASNTDLAATLEYIDASLRRLETL